MDTIDTSKFGEPRIKVVAMPKDSNPHGNVFGGWILSQIDLAGAIAAREIAHERVVSIRVKDVIFKEPMYIGDIVSFYSTIIAVGNTSITTSVKVVAQRLNKMGFFECTNVTDAEVIYVSVDKNGKKKPLDLEIVKLHGFNQ